MAWIKRNLIFVISCAVGVLLTGFCGYLVYGVMDTNATKLDEYNNKKANYDQLLQTSPFPSTENNKSLVADQQRVQEFLNEFKKSFAPFPVPPPKDEADFKNYLGESLVQFRAGATNASVDLPPNYDFSFASLTTKLNYSPADIASWMNQLQEMKVILDILYHAKVNFIQSICRVPVSVDDSGSGDCLLPTATVTNQWGVVTPFKITFRGFSSELAGVLEGFASASNCFIIKSVDVITDTTAANQMAQQAQQAAQSVPAAAAAPGRPAYNRPPPPSMNNLRDRAFGRPAVSPPPVYARPAAPASGAGAASPSAEAPTLILTESPLLITISVDAIKLKATEK